MSKNINPTLYVAKAKSMADNTWIEGYYCYLSGRHVIVPYDARIFDPDGRGDVIENFVEIDVKTRKRHIGFPVAGANGRYIDVYIGDIIVDWNTGVPHKCSWPIEVKEYAYRLFDSLQFGFSIIEVIGNIEDNPELLEKEYQK